MWQNTKSWCWIVSSVGSKTIERMDSDHFRAMPVRVRLKDNHSIHNHSYNGLVYVKGAIL